MWKSSAATLLAGLALLVGASALAQTDMATAEILMRESGLSKQLDSVAPQVKAGMASALSQGNRASPDAERERIAGLAEEAFAAPRLRATAQAVIAKRTRQAHVAAVLAWMRSPTGGALTRLEEEAAAKPRDPRVAMQEDTALLASLPAKRQALLKQLADVTRSGEALTTITINTAVAVQVGAASVMPSGPALSPGDVRRALEQQRPQMTSAMTGYAVVTYARMYQSAPDADLESYVTFLQSPAGLHFTDVGLRAIDAALVDGGNRLGRSIAGAKSRTAT